MARKLSLPLAHRPMTFTTTIGQENTSKYLAKLVRDDTPRNIILAGSHGSGKTTSGRIYARALNCTELLPNGDPCNQCPNCRMQIAERFPDYIETDLSSNGKVEDIRKLQDIFRTPPTLGKYRVFLGDEAHNATKNAWDALLKVTEEPPPYMVFIFSTTEGHKIRAAIRSRCQSLTVNTIDIPAMAAHLMNVAQKETIPLSPQGAQLIATLSKGHARDALTMLEQASDMQAYEPTEITRILGLNHALKVIPLVEAILDNRMMDALATLEQWPEPATTKRGALADYLTYLALIYSGHNLAVPHPALGIVEEVRHKAILGRAEDKSRFKQERANILLQKLNMAIMSQPVASDQATVLAASIVIVDYINTHLQEASIGAETKPVQRRRQFATLSGITTGGQVEQPQTTAQPAYTPPPGFNTPAGFSITAPASAPPNASSGFSMSAEVPVATAAPQVAPINYQEPPAVSMSELESNSEFDTSQFNSFDPEEY